MVTPLIAEKVLGSSGGILILTMGAMALMSTGSGEVMAISSIIVYDIYQTYLKPFRYACARTHTHACIIKFDADSARKLEYSKPTFSELLLFVNCRQGTHSIIE